MIADALFSPRATALVGASPEFGKYSGKVLHYFSALGYKGALWPVNPKHQTIGGLPCFSSLADLPGRPDHVGIAVSAPHVLATLEQAVKAGARVATVFSAGFAETGKQEDRQLQDRLTDFCRETGLRVIGPNCNGLINWQNGFVLSATSAVTDPNGRAGTIGIVSQSGGLGQISVMWRAMQMGLGISLQASCGNESDLQAFDIAALMVDDPRTEIILLALESIRDGERMWRLAEKAQRAGKPVLAMKLGRTASGMRAATSHTAALAGSDAIHDAALRQAGIIRVNTAQELCDAAMLLGARHAPADQSVVAFSISGGSLVVAADNAEPNGVAFPPFHAETAAKLSRLLPGFIEVSNPTDLSPQAIGDSATFREVLAIIEADPGIGTLLPILTMSQRAVVDAICDFAHRAAKPVVMVWTGGCTDGATPATAGLYHQVPMFRDVEPALKALGHVFAARQCLAGPARTAPVRPTGTDPQAARSLIDQADQDVLSECEAKRVLAAYGLHVTQAQSAITADQAVAAFRSIGGPVVLKIDAPGIAHKSDIGGVALDLRDEVAVRHGFRSILDAAAAHGVTPRGVTAQRMVPPGTEILIGFTLDPIYGPVLAFGPGGVLAEYAGPPVLRLPPLSMPEALAMIDEMPGRCILDGVRGRAPDDIAALVDAIVRFSWLAHDLRGQLTEAEINPLILGATGDGALCVDALLVRKQEPPTP